MPKNREIIGALIFGRNTEKIIQSILTGIGLRLGCGKSSKRLVCNVNLI
jgi:hypothetical protein